MVSVSALDSLDRARHRWYFFKEAFSPEIVKSATADAGCKKDDLIVDPFCGSGTVPLQAALDGQSAAGIEVNPFLAFVANSKIQQCGVAALEAWAETAAKAARRGKKSALTGFSTFTERGELSKWLFNTEVLDAFEGAWQSVDTPTRQGASQQLLKLCLIGAAMDVCNAVKDGKCLRYRTNWKDRAFGTDDFLDAAESRVRIVTEDLKNAPLDSPTVSVRRGDARRRSVGKSFRLCVTSPPYLNSFDYTDVYRPELFLGKWVRDMKDLRALRLRTLRSHVQVGWKNPTMDDFGLHYAESMEAVLRRSSQLWDCRIPRMIQAYFEDMRRVLMNLRSRAQKDASVWLVVSNSAYAGVEIPVDLIIAEVASSCQWYLREIKVVRYLGRVACQQWSELAEKKTNGPHLRESLIILDTRPRGTRNGNECLA
jgi:hypothetical protein